MQVHLVDGTYELFRHFFAVPSHVTDDGREVGAVRAAVGSVLRMLEEGATHLAVATDHVIESFRNEMWPGYKDGSGIDPALLAQFGLFEEVLEAAGITTLVMVEHEADDGLGAMAKVAAADDRVERVWICTPDKDLAQCVGGKVVQMDRRKGTVIDAAGVIEKYGVAPESIPDWLALVGDSADGFPGLSGWGARSAATVLRKFGHIEDIPYDAPMWALKVRSAGTLSATLRDNRADALLFKRLATLELDAPVPDTVDALRWTGPRRELAELAAGLDAPGLAGRASALAAARNA
ncbi:5'-3' exonuclease [Iamia sp.]|uniref:5'-3' exonuclease n=1 Tax=Iamia sp. TaxID=2722710 RepID=UPI002B89A388|nr:5'-3' exonuclease H3TH domain-containing protein [Iamia sp.]HXH59223.1 5'-3' exonuclease H3TH domain-containing protein [Iamia sp.]